MKITNQPAYGVFKNRMPEGGAVSAERGLAPGAKRMDKNSLPHGVTSVSDRQMLLLKSSVQDYIYAPAGNERLDAIRDGIHNGTYRIPTSDIVEAIITDDI